MNVAQTRQALARVPARRLGWLLACLALLAGAAGVFAFWPAGSTHVVVAGHERPLRFSLRSGDGLLVAPGSELVIEAQEPGARRVQLASGAALFEVTKRAAPFVVQTDHARFTAQEALFTVEVQLGRSVLRVYRGAAQARGRTIAAGSAWTSAGVLPEQGAVPLAPELRDILRVPAAALNSASGAPALLATDPRALLAEARAALTRGDAQHALELVERSELDEERSPVREQATLLRIDALLALGHESAARVHVLRYLAREPESTSSARLRALIAPPRPR